MYFSIYLKSLFPGSSNFRVRSLFEYLVHLMQRADSVEKTLIPRKTEGKKKEKKAAEYEIVR